MFCLNDFIGITASTDKKIVDALKDGTDTSWFNKSESGLFVDQIPFAPKLEALDATVCSDLGKFYKKGLESAKQTLVSDLTVQFGSRYREKSKMYIGRAGGWSFATNLAFPTGKAGLWIQNEDMRGGKIIIKAIHLVFATAITNLELYKIANGQYEAEKIMDITVDSINLNQLTTKTLANPISLDMKDYTYMLLYDTSGVQAKNNSVSCGCGNIELNLKRFIQLVGVVGSDLTNVTTMQQSQNGNGLALDVQVGCDATNIVCELMEADNSYRTVLAWALMYKTVENTIEAILNSHRLNQYTLNDREHMYGKRNEARKNYNDRVLWFSETVNVAGLTDCYMCNDGNKKIYRGSILA